MAAEDLEAIATATDDHTTVIEEVVATQRCLNPRCSERIGNSRRTGIHPSFGFLEEPETNGVVERWNRTLKEQAIYGRVFRNLAEVRAAVAAFVERYNQQYWRLEKLAYRTPLEAREEYKLRQAA